MWKLSSLADLGDLDRFYYLLLGQPNLDICPQIAPTNTIEMQLLQRLEEERLAGYALHNLQKPSSIHLQSQFSDEFNAKLRRLAFVEFQTRQQMATYAKALAKALSGLEEHIIWLKGPGLSSLYPSPALRQFGDLDLLVEKPYLAQTISALTASGYYLDQNESALSKAGPSREAADFILQPNDQYVSCDAMTLRNSDGAYIELKLDPLERGLALRGIDRLQKEAVISDFEGLKIRCPELSYQILIACCHLHKDFFCNDRQLLDIHILTNKLNETGFDWKTLVSLARYEGVASSVWAALSLCRDRLGTAVPEEIIASLKSNRPLNKFLAYSLNYRFLWNQNSFPILLFEALSAEDSTRKMQVLFSTFFPSAEFLRAYYWKGSSANLFLYIGLWLCHCYVVVMPGGAVKRTLGKIFWLEST